MDPEVESRLGRKKTCFKTMGRKCYWIGLKEDRLGKKKKDYLLGEIFILWCKTYID